MSDVMMNALQINVESLTRQVEQLALENERVRKLLTEFDERHDRDQARIRELERRASSERQRCRAEMIRLAKGVEGKNSDMELAYLRAADALRTLAGEGE